MSGVLWITGLSGAGKTTLARNVVNALRTKHTGAWVVHVDGDKLRAVFGNDLGHGETDRKTNAWRIARTCEYLLGEGALVVCSTMSLFPEIWSWNRAHLSPYLEVALAVPIDVLRARDTKGLYRPGVTDVAGIDLAVAWPASPDLALSSDGDVDLARNTELLVGKALDMIAGRPLRRSA